MISALIGQCKGWTIRKVMVGEVWGGGERVGPQEVVNEKIYIFLRILAKQNMHKEDTRRICAGNTFTDQL